MAKKPEIVDLIGLGFGPANIAIACAITEAWKEDSSFPVKTTLFIERYDVFRWHPGMLLPGAKMQISFMKDLATLRNPESPYTFLAYLHSESRLLSFINRGSTIPTRREYSDYLSWAARKVQDDGINVSFGHEITDLKEGHEDTILVRYRNLRTGEEKVVLARDMVISPGGSPRIPEVVTPFASHPRVCHSSGYATSIEAIFESLSHLSRPLRVAVIGAGQSAAEVTMDLRNRLAAIPPSGDRHTVDMLIRKGSLKPSDDSPFTNEIFDPAATDACYSMPSKRVREFVTDEYKQTNYGVVNPVTLQALYEIIYDQQLNAAIARRTGSAERQNAFINIRVYTDVASVKLTLGTSRIAPPAALLFAPEEKRNACKDEAFQLTLRNVITSSITEVGYDAILYATGYQRGGWADLLKHSGIGKHFGLSPASGKVNLATTTDLRYASSQTVLQHSSSESASPAISSTNTTPPTSPGPSVFSSAQFEEEMSTDLYLTRQYRLLATSRKSLVPRIYLQGVEETTHGLSDTLLSVLGVRAGEVVSDLARRHDA